MSACKFMTDLLGTMAAATSAKTARHVISTAEHRLADVEHIGWPALEQSLRVELEQLREMAQQKGLA